VVVEAAAWRALGVAARPGGHIDGEHQRVGVQQDARQQVAKPLGIDLAAGKGGVDAAPAAPADQFQAQVRQRRDRRSAQQRIAEFEQRVGAAGETGMQLSPEVAEPRKGEGWHRHGRAA
jgi:hypothetical protein